MQSKNATQLLSHDTLCCRSCADPMGTRSVVTDEKKSPPATTTTTGCLYVPLYEISTRSPRECSHRKVLYIWYICIYTYAWWRDQTHTTSQVLFSRRYMSRVVVDCAGGQNRVPKISFHPLRESAPWVTRVVARRTNYEFNESSEHNKLACSGVYLLGRKRVYLHTQHGSSVLVYSNL